MYGETTIANYEGETVIVDYAAEDMDSAAYTRKIVDLEGNLLKEENLVSETCWYDEIYEDGVDELSNEDIIQEEKISVTNTEEGVFVYDQQGNQVACFKSKDTEMVTVYDADPCSIYGRISGNYLIIEDNDMYTYFYRIK